MSNLAIVNGCGKCYSHTYKQGHKRKGDLMAISVMERKGGGVKIVGSQTYANGMTMTFHDPDENGSVRKYHSPMWYKHHDNIKSYDMHHAREWLAGDKPASVRDTEDTEVDDGRKMEGVWGIRQGDEVRAKGTR